VRQIPIFFFNLNDLFFLLSYDIFSRNWRSKFSEIHINTIGTIFILNFSSSCGLRCNFMFLNVKFQYSDKFI